MEKLRRVLSGQDDEEQGLTAQVTSPDAATVGGGPRTAVGKSAPGVPGYPVPAACFPVAFLGALPFCIHVPWSLQRALRLGAGLPVAISGIPGLDERLERGHRREATSCRRLPVKPALPSDACFLLTEPLPFACDPDMRLDKDLLPPVRL